jgi:hypothetical protein
MAEKLIPLIPVVLAGLVLALFCFLQREKFDAIARGVFLVLEKEMHTAEGEAKMAEAVLRIIDILPDSVKSALGLAAFAMRMSLPDLIKKLCQKTFDLIFPEPTA